MELSCDLWEKISYTLADHPPSLCLLSKSSSKLRDLVRFVVGHYEAHLHITFPNNECWGEGKSSKEKVQFEMILNRKGKYHRGKAHFHSIFTCSTKKIDLAIDDLLDIFSKELITLRFNNFPEVTNLLTVFSKFTLPKCEDICFNGSLPVHNGVFDVFQSCLNVKRLVISNPKAATDFSEFWPKLKGSRLETMDLMVSSMIFQVTITVFVFWDIESFHHSSTKELRLPQSLRQLFFCPKQDIDCQYAENIAKILYSGNWKQVYIHSESVLEKVNSRLYKPLKSVTEFCFSSKAFTVDYVISFLKKCNQIKCFNWFGLHSCVAPIVIARLLTDIPRSIVFGGCVACKSGETVGNGGFMEVGNRVNVVRVTKLLEREEFRSLYGEKLADAVLFERPFETNSVSVIYIQKKDSVCGPNCIDIHEISEKAGLSL
uniref:MFS domain-containing protein n=1 Tax=Caenorhabditis tropicalis TaxID=1561998 RepID=A0A1I7T7X3_9PELO